MGARHLAKPGVSSIIPLLNSSSPYQFNDPYLATKRYPQAYVDYVQEMAEYMYGEMTWKKWVKVYAPRRRDRRRLRESLVCLGIDLNWQVGVFTAPEKRRTR